MCRVSFGVTVESVCQVSCGVSERKVVVLDRVMTESGCHMRF